MTFGNHIGFKFTATVSDDLLFNPVYGGFLVELDDATEVSADFKIIGMTSLDYTLTLSNGTVIDLTILQEKYDTHVGPAFARKMIYFYRN